MHLINRYLAKHFAATPEKFKPRVYNLNKFITRAKIYSPSAEGCMLIAHKKINEHKKPVQISEL
jgi:hypothetical protein